MKILGHLIQLALCLRGLSRYLLVVIGKLAIPCVLSDEGAVAVVGWITIDLVSISFIFAEQILRRFRHRRTARLLWLLPSLIKLRLLCRRLLSCLNSLIDLARLHP